MKNIKDYPKIFADEIRTVSRLLAADGKPAAAPPEDIASAIRILGAVQDDTEGVLRGAAGALDTVRRTTDTIAADPMADGSYTLAKRARKSVALAARCALELAIEAAVASGKLLNAEESLSNLMDALTLSQNRKKESL